MAARQNSIATMTVLAATAAAAYFYRGDLMRGFVRGIPDQASIHEEFEEFREKFGKVYQSAEERAERLAIFTSNYLWVLEENARGSSVTLALNQFADLTAAEFAMMHHQMGKLLTGAAKLWDGVPYLGTHTFSGAPLQKDVDWVARGAVSSVKTQGMCGSCWTFSAAGALEGAWHIKTGELVTLSSQQLIDCTSNGRYGCQGGLMDYAFKYDESAGICTEASYPYHGKAGEECHDNNCTVAIPKGAVIGYKDVPRGNESALMEALSQQPVSVAIQADQRTFQFYKSGVIAKGCGDKVDHGALAVGYGTDDGLDYWKVKNSWGPGWGEQGFVRIERGASGNGECGVQLEPSYPVLDGGLAAKALDKLLIV